MNFVSEGKVRCPPAMLEPMLPQALVLMALSLLVFSGDLTCTIVSVTWLQVGSEL